MTVAILNAHDEHCTKGALTGIFGWLLQFILASLAFTCLIAKRYCEPRFERRPWRIWFYDTSKQGLGSLFMHMSNIFISGRFQGDPCTWYIINFLLDSSVGLLIIYIGIRLTQFIAKEKKWSAINFGEYGMPPSTHAWMMQCCLYILLMFVVKVIITLLIQFKFWTKVREFILYPFPNQDVELAVVMLIIPLVVNQKLSIVKTSKLGLSFLQQFLDVGLSDSLLESTCGQLSDADIASVSKDTNVKDSAGDDSKVETPDPTLCNAQCAINTA
ncbi:hypothetical protein J6590_069394 [Homalodisca vitripennis]|nr:hypothetical protein J6590_069394 [Homalodisca vitripennis]